MRHLIPTLALALTAAPLAAQDEDIGGPVDTASGTVTGTLNFEDVAWSVTSEDILGGSRWQDADSGRLVRIVATPERDHEGRGGALMIEFVAAGGPAAYGVAQPQVSFQPEGADDVWTAGPENVDLIVEALTVEGDEMALGGSIFATMVPGGSDELIIEAEDSLRLDGNFQATIYSDQ
ncbi:hypothetical protein [Tranquillimonas alkanivorans]|uniref:Uncharacterized protein n=1 Tax=Tranquillimonas alkanivorans TaxID=441119 RepID=A0A1I5W716_9RHOB|nr:hypothetical protein [Tranquillimonas alkanivorans]SFQ15443.1 hypothetical protein SAMN04488047_1417 [Tranquillimonas alkanivorans]